MKKVILIILIFITFNTVFAIDKAKILEAKIVANILIDLENGKPRVCFYKFDREDAVAYSLIENIKVYETCENADFILVKKLEEKKEFEKPAFALDYISFRNCINCIGVFYWRKGRPQIVLIKENIEKFKLKPNEKIKKYIIPLKLVKK